MKPILICLYGETCAGKSTLGKNLSARLGCRYISFGDLKRDEIKQRTRLGVQIQFLLDRECPIPAELGYGVIKGAIENDSLNIVSGYPISIDEFRVISRNALVAGIIELRVDESTLIMRLGTRRECPICHLPGVIGDVCPKHNIDMIQRDDVGIDELLRRRMLYRQRIEPFLQLEEIRQIPNLRLDSSTLTREDVAYQAVVWINSTLINRGERVNQKISNPALRIKMTGVCNRTCSFCNEEGDMRTIDAIEPSPAFFDCVRSLLGELNISKVMLTGGEPTIHPDLYEIVEGIKASDVSITTNGIRPLSVDAWTQLKAVGLLKVIVSIHDTTPQSFLQLETRRRKFSWAVRSLYAQRTNLVAASKAGLRVRVNTVVYGSYEQVRTVIDTLSDLRMEYHFDIRLLNDLANVERSQRIIREVCESLGAKIVTEERRAGSSNATVLWEVDSGFRFSTKMAFKYFFDAICHDCPIKNQCYEGFYGIRLERRVTGYWIRLCIYKNTPEVLMPWHEFLQSGLADKFKTLCEQDRI